DSAPRVTSPAAEEGSMQQTLNELTALCNSLQRQHSELLAKFQAQEVEINRFKERVKHLEDQEGVIGDKSGDDAPIKGRISTSSEVGPTPSPIVRRRKGKEILVESDTPKKNPVPPPVPP
nr:hypothetical protein [Tanacetum cinerariifolium]